MSKKTNPRRQPRTQADVDRAVRDAKFEAVEDMLVILFTAMRDYCGMSNNRCMYIHKQALRVAESLNKGYTTIPQLRWVLREEAGFEFTTGPVEEPKKKTPMQG